MATNKVIKVKSNLKPNNDGSQPLAFRERDNRHPKKDVWVSGDKIVEVFETPAVVEAIKNDKIVVVSEEEAAEVEKSKESTSKKTAQQKPNTQATQQNDASKTAPRTDASPLPEGLPHRDVLERQGIKTVGDLKSKTEKQMLDLEDIGEVRLKEIADFMKTQKVS